MKVDGKVFYVTGGCSGLGLAVTQDFIRRGALVSILDLNDVEGKKLQATFGRACLLYFNVDVTNETQVIDALNATKSGWPDKAIAGVVNCAGVSHSGGIVKPDGTPCPLDAFKRIIDINLTGTVNVTRLVVSQIVQQYPKPKKPGLVSPKGDVPDVLPDAVDEDRGCVILTSSQAGSGGTAGFFAYSASKAGVSGLALPLARDLARHGIRVVAIAPSVFKTPINAQAPSYMNAMMLNAAEYPPRLGRPDEFAHIVHACIENSMINGSVIPLDGATRPPKL